jgi:hypothetical protein
VAIGSTGFKSQTITFAADPETALSSEQTAVLLSSTSPSANDRSTVMPSPERSEAIGRPVPAEDEELERFCQEMAHIWKNKQGEKGYVL